MITKEQASELKNQLIAHIESSFPEDKKSDAIERVEIMDEVELEDFLIKNGLLQNSEKKFVRDCVFCHISSGGIKSTKISENEHAVAVLEINPISKGHALIIPKHHSAEIEDDAKDSVLELQKNISKLLKERLNPKNILTNESNLFGHKTISLIPQYKDETLESNRYAASQEELKEIQIILSAEEKSKGDDAEKNEEKDKEKKDSEEKPKTILEFFHLPKRIP